jgi:hypothetical protein
MSIPVRSGESPQTVINPSRLVALAGATCAAASVVGLLVTVAGPVAVAVVVAGGCLFGVVAWRPVLATYLYLATLPFIAGIDRGTLVPGMRPNEALLVVVVAGAATGGYIRVVKGAPVQFRLRPWEVPLAVFALLATVWPIGSLMLRGVSPQVADVIAVFPVCKLIVLYLLVRTTVRDSVQVLWCIRLVVGGAVGLAAIAVLQTLNFGPVLHLLSTWWGIEPGAGSLSERGSATLTSAVITGNYILFGLTLLITSGRRGLFGKRAQLGAGLVLLAGLLAAGQFSTWLGALLVAVLLFGRVPAARVSALRLAPLAAIAVLVGAPALLRRLGELSGGSMPHSWAVRWHNVSHLYLPELFGHGGFLIGVSPNAVVVPPDTWRDVVYLESGYLTFLWMGGIPLLAAFVVLSWAVLKQSRQLSTRTDGVGACASTLFAAWWVVVLLLLLDPHLFMRGEGDLIFVLLAIVGSSASDASEEGTRNASA